MGLKQDAESVSHEDGIRIHLHCPIIVEVAGVLDDLLPQSYEDVGVQGRLEFATVLAFEAYGDNPGHQSGGHLHRPVAVDLELVAREEVRGVLVLAPEEPHLVAVRHDEGEAEERRARGRRRQPRNDVVVGWCRHGRGTCGCRPGRVHRPCISSAAGGVGGRRGRGVPRPREGVLALARAWRRAGRAGVGAAPVGAALGGAVVVAGAGAGAGAVAAAPAAAVAGRAGAGTGAVAAAGSGVGCRLGSN
mmetsp:Transcript_51348/g.164432  ORF Transcript_51348/g.164432 Transcript_51348/m.164432 type:complete len:247 (-) Transcript_51348:501-1241(-)